MTRQAKARLLMCPPDHFGVRYAINPWMDPLSWARDDQALAAASHHEWARLRDTLLKLGASIELVPAVPGVPDLVFTANAAVVLDGRALLAHFRHPERQKEEIYFEAAFRALQRRGLINNVGKLPDHVVLEGAGDCVWDSRRNLFWMGYGPRSDAAARDIVKETFRVEAIALELTDHRFYHMDTALCPLSRGEVMFVPDAFTEKGKATIYDLVEPRQRISVDVDDACRLAANAVRIGSTLVMSSCGDRLRSNLTERGYHVVTTPLCSFLRSGGSAFCLSLRLDHLSNLETVATNRAAAA
jgi:N-dimethylarginine dimethylaminohydrolase